MLFRSRRDDPPGNRPPAPRRGVPAGGAAVEKTLRMGGLTVTSSAIGPDGKLAVEFTCDGAGISPPVEWEAGLDYTYERGGRQ